MEFVIPFLIKFIIYVVLGILVTIFPVYLESPVIRFKLTPYWTIGLIFMNVTVFLILFLGNIWKPGLYFNTLKSRGVIPYEITHGVDLPPPNGLGIIGVYLNIFTSMFLHGGFFHLLGNMQFLWLFGPSIETGLNLKFNHRNRAINKSIKFIIFYLICGVGAVIVYSICFFNSKTILIGSSGAISGLLGAYILKFWRDYPKAHILILYVKLQRLNVNYYILFWIILQVVLHSWYGSFSPVAYLAHIGGFFTGLLLAFFLPWAGMRPGRWR